MALCVGDIHGNMQKAKMFLDYKPEEQHIFVGDFADSYHASDKDIIDTLQYVLDYDCIILAGNHDIQYFRNSTTSLKCTGYRNSYAYILEQIIEKNKDLFQATYIADDYLVSHGGIVKALTKYTDFNTIEDINDWCNEEFDKWKNSPVVQTTLSPIFNIGSARGGWDSYSGIFWASIGYDKFDKRFNQVVGHTRHNQPLILDNGKKYNTRHIGIDTDFFYCYNTKTHNVEDFMMEEFKKTRNMLERTF